MYVVTLSVFHNLAIWLLYVNKPELLLDWKLEWDEHTNNYLFIITQCYLLTIGLDDDVNMALVCFVDCGFDTVYVVN